MKQFVISYLLMQAMRYNITGIMPDAFGVEEEHFRHPESCVWLLGACGALLAVGCCSIVVLQNGVKIKDFMQHPLIYIYIYIYMWIYIHIYMYMQPIDIYRYRNCWK